MSETRSPFSGTAHGTELNDGPSGPGHEVYQKTFVQAPLGVAHIDHDGRFLRVNPRLAQLLGYGQDELERLSMPELCTEGAWKTLQRQFDQLTRDGMVPRSCELALKHRNGETIWVYLSTSTLRDDCGRFQCYISIIEDISGRKAVERQLELTATVFDSNTESIIVTDHHRRIVKVNRAFCETTGYSSEEVLEQSPRLLSSGRHDRHFYERMWKNLEMHGRWQGEVWNRRKNGEIYPTWLTICAITNGHGQVCNYVGISGDISLRKATLERLTYQANHDSLTGLPNRVLLGDRLGQALAHARRDQRPIAILFLDLDRFKIINDTLGHDIGDLLLQEVARRLSATVRRSDTVARWGGDEFVILLDRIRFARDAGLVAQKVLTVIQEPCSLRGHELFVTGSIGISLFPQDSADFQMLLKHADTAMYRAKESGKNGYEFYTAEMNIRAMERFKLESDLRRALDRDELLLYYQPKVDVFTGRIIGVEALLRWDHPSLGMLRPKEFVPLAEESDLIYAVGEWALWRACRQTVDWKKAGFALPISVNISARHFARSNFAATLEQLLHETGLAPHLLELEITENMMASIADKALAALYDLTGLGVRISIDDFGTGYSSIRSLKHLPLESLKIDGSFVRNLPEIPSDAAIASAIISLGHSLELKVVAEGIETEAQLAFLKAKRCDAGQGHLFSQPLPPDGLLDLLRAGQLPSSMGLPTMM